MTTNDFNYIQTISALVRVGGGKCDIDDENTEHRIQNTTKN